MDISLHPEVISKFRQWYDAVWLGDEEHGQTIPQSFSDARYVEYINGYTLALGAWIESARQTANLNLLEAGLLDAHEPEREGPKFLDWVADTGGNNDRRTTNLKTPKRHGRMGCRKLQDMAEAT